MSVGSLRYVIVTPVRDEAGRIEQTIEAVLSQTVPPAEWVIVNDGSSDRTGEIIDRHSREYPWVRALHLTDRGFRKPGGGVVEAFYAGFRSLQCGDWEFIVKLDGDLSFSADYFERALEHFRAEPRLGIGGGTLYNFIDGKMQVEDVPRFHVRGATKIYRRDCWEAIGGLRVAPGWDIVDEVKANMLGWTTQSFPDVQLVHQRFTGGADGWWGNAFKNGRACYFAGYHPAFMAAKCAYRLAGKPYLVGALGMIWGYVTGYLKRVPQVDDPTLIRYLRREQIKRLLGKETIWE